MTLASEGDETPGPTVAGKDDRAARRGRDRADRPLQLQPRRQGVRLRWATPSRLPASPGGRGRGRRCSASPALHPGARTRLDRCRLVPRRALARPKGRLDHFLLGLILAFIRRATGTACSALGARWLARNRPCSRSSRRRPPPQQHEIVGEDHRAVIERRPCHRGIARHVDEVDRAFPGRLVARWASVEQGAIIVERPGGEDAASDALDMRGSGGRPCGNGPGLRWHALEIGADDRLDPVRSAVVAAVALARIERVLKPPQACREKTISAQAARPERIPQSHRISSLRSCSWTLPWRRAGHDPCRTEQQRDRYQRQHHQARDERRSRRGRARGPCRHRRRSCRAGESPLRPARRAGSGRSADDRAASLSSRGEERAKQPAARIRKMVVGISAATRR